MKFNISKFNNLTNTPYIILAIVGIVFLLSSCEKDYPTNPTILDKFKTHESIELDAKLIFSQIEEQANKETITIDLSHIKPNWVFSMFKDEIYNTDSKAIELKNGVEQVVELEKAFFLYGTDKTERPSLMVSRASGFYLEFLDNERLQIIEALSDHDAEATENQYIVYTSEDLIIEDKHLYGSYPMPPSTGSINTNMASSSAKMVHANRFFDVTCVSDLGFRGKIGNSVDTFNEMYDILFLGGARFWFYSDYNLKPRMKDIYIDYSDVIPAQTATATEGLLAFRNSYPNRNEDASLLFTDKLLPDVGVPGIILGAAYVGVACSKKYKSHMYNVHWPHDFVRHQLFAHEMAHIFNAGHHDQNGPMEAQILDATSVNFYWKAENEMDLYLEDDANEACLLD